MPQDNSDLDISVLMATYNRAEILHKTLDSMMRLDLKGLSVEFVVVDNNSSDTTKQVVESFVDRLPLRYLFEPRPGKNCALNRALDGTSLGKIVVFCDDDIVPPENWLTEIVATCRRWPNYSVFGGRTSLVWPEIDIPSWARSRLVKGWGLGQHDYLGQSQCPYPPGGHPTGANFWIRRDVFAGGRRYDESIGPRPGKSFIMGSEASFLLQLAADGYSAMYIPNIVVGHRVHPELLSVAGIRKRAYRCGRGYPHLQGLPRETLLNKHPVLWWFVRIGALARCATKYALAMMSLSPDQRVIQRVLATMWIAYNIESLKIANNIRRDRTKPDKIRLNVGFVPFFPDNPYQSELGKHLGGNGFDVQDVCYRGVLFKNFFDGKKLDILHLHWLAPLFLSPSLVKSFCNAVILLAKLFILRLRGVKLIWTVHNLESHEQYNPKLDMMCRRWVAWLAHALISHSETAREQICSRLRVRKTNKVFVVPHGNYINCYPNELSRAESRKILGIPDSLFVLLFLGEIRPYKGVLELIEAAKQIDNPTTEWKLIIAGRPLNNQTVDAIRKRVANRNNIGFIPGFVEDHKIQVYMNACDAVVFPYQKILTSGAVVLAMSFGQACIAPRSGCVSDMLDDSGAFLYNPGEQDGLLKAIRCAIERRNELRQMSEHNRKIIEKYSWDSAAQKTLDIYQWCLRR